MNRVVETHNIVLEGCPSGRNHTLNTHVLTHFFDDSRRLESEFSSRNEDQNCWVTISTKTLEKKNKSLSSQTATFTASSLP
jgi:hypothetical protein